MAAPSKSKASEKSLTQSPKKRKKDDNSSIDNTPEPKQRKTGTFTEVDFKFLLRDPSTLFSGFEKFLDAAENWPDADYDIVDGYCRSSPECTEILHVLDAGKRKPQELQLIFGCLERIMLRIADDLNKYYSTGQHLVKTLLSTQLHSIYFVMKMTNKSSQIKTALKMLVAMVMLGASSTKMVLSHLDLGHYNMKHLFNRRDTKDEEDVRTCLLHLIIAFLLSGDNEVIRRLADTKGFLENMFQGMVFDRVSTIQLVLSTVLEKIVMNAAVSKTSKVHVFTETTLKQLGQLYSWKGPSKWKGSLQSKHNKRPSMDIQEEEEDMLNGDMRTLASEIGHKFLTEVCSSYKHGIVFMDKTYGLSGKNQNHILTSFLTSLIPISHNALVQELVMKILVASPDQLQYFVPQMVHMLSPRPTAKWVDSVGFLYKIYEGLPSEPHVLRLTEPRSVSDMVDLLLVYTVPPGQVINTLLPGLKNTSLAVNHATLSIVKLMAERAVQILGSVHLAMTSGPLHSMYTEEERLDLVTVYTDTILKMLPDVMTVFQCWDKLQSLHSDQEDMSQLLQLQDMCHCGLSDVQVRLEQVLCLYQDLVPSLLVDHPVGLGKLLDGVINTEGDHAGLSDSIYLPQMYLLKLLAGTDARRLPWGKKNSTGKSLLYQLLEMVTHTCARPQIGDITLELICKLLESTGLFESCHEELVVWIKTLGNYGHKSEASSTVLSFVSKVLMSYMSNPYPYMDRVCDLVSNIAVLETTLETGRDVMNDNKIEAVLAMDIESLEEEDDDMVATTGQTSTLTAQKRFPFCPMMLVALDLLQKADSPPTEMNSYMSAVVLNTFHQQVDPLPFCILMKCCDSNKFVDGLHGYIQLWSSQGSDMGNKQTLGTGDLLTVQKCLEVDGYMKLAGDNTHQPCDIIQQNLLHLTFLLQHKPKKGDKSFSQNLKSLVQIIEDAVRQADGGMSGEEHSEKNIFPPEFSLLNIKRPSTSELMTSCVRLVLSHPKVRSSFLAEIHASQSLTKSVSQVLTGMVIYMLDMVRQYKLNVGCCFEHYHLKVLDCLKSLMNCEVSEQERREISKPVFTSLKYIAENLEVEKCADVLNSVLTLVEVKGNCEQVDSVCEVVDDLLQKLTLSNIRLVSLSENGINNMICCYLQKTGESISVHFTQFFEKYPNLAVFCTEKNLQQLLNTDCYLGIAEIVLRVNPLLREKFGDMILQAESGVKADRHMLLVESYLTIAVAKETVTDHEQAVAVKCGEIYKAKLLELCGQDKVKHSAQILHLCKQLVQLNALGKKSLSKLEKRLLGTIEMGEKVRPHHIALLQVVLGCGGTVGYGKTSVLLQICIQCLTKMLDKKASRNQNVENAILDILSGYSKTELEKLVASWSEFAGVWPQFVKASLKNLYTDKRLLNFLANLVPVVYCDSYAEISVTIDALVAMVMSHSSFFPVMLDTENHDSKESLVDLLLQLIQLSPSSCEKDHVGIYLGAYTATMSVTDQKLLKLLQMYERNNINFTDFKPYTWGEKAIEQHSLHKTLGPSLKRATMAQVLDNIDLRKIQQTILHFPLRRKLQGGDIQNAINYKSTASCYDPCFLLPLFSNLLAPDAVVDCKKFIEHDCLSFTLSALSSHDQSVRSASYHILDRYRIHLESARLQEKEQIIYLMELLRNSLPSPKCKLASIVTLFLARTTKLMLKPDEHMYGIINSFLLLKPSLDVLNIPEFYKLFNSSAYEYKIERSWILSLMHDGLRETADYRIFERRYTFKLLQSFYDSDTANMDCQLKVLQILQSACKERTVALDLSRNHGIIVWIATAVSKLSPDSTKLVCELTQLVHCLWMSGVGKYERSLGVSEDKPQQLQAVFTGQVLSVLQTLLWYMRDVSEDVLLIYVRTLLSVITLTNVPTSEQERSRRTTSSTISHIDILLMLLHSAKFVESKLSSQSIIEVLKGQGFDTSLLMQSKGSSSRRKEKFQHLQDAESGMVPSERRKESSAEFEDKTSFVKDNVIANVTTETHSTSHELSQSLVKILLMWKSPTGENIAHEMFSTNLMIISWLISQIESGRAQSILANILQWIENLVRRENLGPVKSVIGSLSHSTEVSDFIVTGLLNTYAVNISAAGKVPLNCSMDSGMGEPIPVRYVNNILVPVVSRRHGLSGTDLEQLCDDLCDRGPLSVSKDDLLSVVLRRLFLQRETIHSVSTYLSSHTRKRKGEHLGPLADPSKKNKKKSDLTVNNQDVSKGVEKLNLNESINQDQVDLVTDKMTKLKTKKRKSMNMDIVDIVRSTPSKKTKKDRNTGRKM